MFHIINKFNQINLIKNSLIVLDIDNTILAFNHITDKWWNDTFQQYHNSTKNIKLAEQYSIEEWHKQVCEHHPSLVDDDFHEWFNKTQEYNCDIILLTARNVKYFDTTIKHLEKINLPIDKKNIYFNDNKGKELFEIVFKYYFDTKQIIVVDDIENNLIDINNNFLNSNYKLTLYKMASL